MLPPQVKAFALKVAVVYARAAQLALSLMLFFYIVACLAAGSTLGLHEFVEFVAYVFRFHPAQPAGQGD